MKRLAIRRMRVNKTGAQMRGEEGESEPIVGEL